MNCEKNKIFTPVTLDCLHESFISDKLKEASKIVSLFKSFGINQVEVRYMYDFDSLNTTNPSFLIYNTTNQNQDRNVIFHGRIIPIASINSSTQINTPLELGILGSFTNSDGVNTKFFPQRPLGFYDEIVTGSTGPQTITKFSQTNTNVDSENTKVTCICSTILQYNTDVFTRFAFIGSFYYVKTQ